MQFYLHEHLQVPADDTCLSGYPLSIATVAKVTYNEYNGKTLNKLALPLLGRNALSGHNTLKLLC